MKVLFLEVEHERTWAVASIGPAYLTAYLRQHGHEVVMRRVALDLDGEAIAGLVRAEAPGLVGLSLTTRQWQRARVVVRELRARVDVPVVAGGLHPTFSPGAVLSEPGFDFVCEGEGEGALLDLVAALEARGRHGPDDPEIPNIHVRGAKAPARRAPFSPIDALPFMARDVLDEYPGCHHMCTQRGCPFPCTYCAARMFDELYAGEGFGRRRSHESVVAELEQLRARGPLNYVIFLDDTFTIHHPWVKEFCKIYRERFRGVGFSLHARVETVSQELLLKLADAGCKHITYGVESGSERVRRDIMRRPVTNQRFKDVFRWTKEAGILCTANYMLGLPGETREDLEQTLALDDELRPDDFGYFVFYPFPGTALFHTCKEQGLLPPDYLDLPANHRRTILRLRDLTQADIDEYYARFTAVRERRYGAAAAGAGVQRSAAVG